MSKQEGNILSRLQLVAHLAYLSADTNNCDCYVQTTVATMIVQNSLFKTEDNISFRGVEKQCGPLDCVVCLQILTAYVEECKTDLGFISRPT